MDRDVAISLLDILADIKLDLDGILAALTPETPEEPANDNT